MPFDDNELMDLYRARPTEARGAGCIDADVLRRAVVREITQDERNSMVEHLRVCPECSSAYRAAHAAHAWANREAGVSDADGPRVAALRDSSPWLLRGQRLRALALAAMLLIVAAIGLVIWRTAPLTGSRSDGERGVRAIATAVSPANGATLDAFPSSLRWEPVAGVGEYRVEIFDDELTSVWTSDPLSAPTVDVPQGLGTMLGSGRPIFWRVTAGTGIDRKRSDLFRFQIAGP